MFYLLGSIIFTSYLTLSFKALEKLGIDRFQAIVFNYITCVITGSFVNKSFPVNEVIIYLPWFRWACIMGATFIILLNIVAFTAQKIGVAVASVANKLSLVVPFLASLYLYNERSTILKLSGIFVALIAVVLTCYPGKKQLSAAGKPAAWILFLVPLCLFLGSGLLDTMIKYVEQEYLDESNKDNYLITTFAAAATIGTLFLIFHLVMDKQRLSWKAILGGIAIGIPNYFSIWCLLRVLQLHPGNSSAVIPINNMGIVLFSSVTAWIVFQEKLSVINWIGIGLSMVAIALIAY